MRKSSSDRARDKGDLVKIKKSLEKRETQKRFSNIHFTESLSSLVMYQINLI